MGSLKENAMRIRAAKESIRTAISEKGVYVPENAKIDDYSVLIQSIAEGDVLIANGQYSIDGNKVRITVAGYFEQQTIEVGTEQGGTTYTPGTTYMTIPAGTYLSGDVIIKGDANLIPDNIAEGVTLFGVAGTHAGGGGGGAFSVVKVTEYSPYVPAYPARVGYNIVSLTIRDMAGEVDLSADTIAPFLGLYSLTEETKGYTGFCRIYKNPNGMFISGWDSMTWNQATEDSDPANCQWMVTSSLTDQYSSMLMSSYGLADPPTAMDQWQSAPTPYRPTALTMATEETHPATEEIPMVLKGAEVDSYDNSTITWSVKGTAKDYSEYEQEPIEGGVYATYNNKFVGHYISVDRDVEAFADIYAPFTARDATDKKGNTIKYLNTYANADTYVFGEYQGVQCVRGSYIDFDCDHPMKKPMSVSFWHLNTQINLQQYIFNFGSSTGNTTYHIGIRGINDKGKIIAITYNESSGTSYIGNVEANKWYHYAITYNPEGIVRWYINGELVGETYNYSFKTASNFTNIGLHSYDPGYGDMSPITTHFDADFRVFWNKVLEPDDIKKLYLMGPNPSENEDTTVIGKKIKVAVEETAPPFLAGTYVLKDSKATGFDRVWEMEDNPQYTIKWEGSFWSFYDGDLQLTYIGQGENPWDAQPANLIVRVIE